MDILMCIYMVLIGCCVGLLSGFFGIGGGILIVPIISYFYNFPLAVSISLGAMILSSGITVASHWKAKNISWHWIVKLLPGMVIGVVAGIIAHRIIHADFLKLALYVIMIIVGIQFFFSKKVSDSTNPNPVCTNAYGGFLGVLSGMLGIGVGSFCIPYLVYYRTSLKHSAAIVSGCTLIVSLIGFLFLINQKSFFSEISPHLFWRTLLAVGLSGALVSPIAVHISHKLNVTILKQVFAVLLISSGLAMLAISVI